MKKLSLISLFLIHFLIFSIQNLSSSALKKTASEHFNYIYSECYAHLIPSISSYSETCYLILKLSFGFDLSERTALLIADSSDMGSGKAITIPHNTILIQIAPQTDSYEMTLLSNQWLWTISHELTHLFFADQRRPIAQFLQPLFGKITPDTQSPYSALFSHWMNPYRFTPSWHQEGIAIYMETWINGGLGRLFSAYDEMALRTQILNKQPLLSYKDINKEQRTRFTLGMDSYLYGARFNSWLAAKNGHKTLMNWHDLNSTESKSDSYEERFNAIYKTSIKTKWEQYIREETEHHASNITRLSQYPTTSIQTFGPTMGWISSPVFDPSEKKIYFGSLRGDKIPSIIELDLNKQTFTPIIQLKNPALVSVCSLALDPDNQILYFTDNNSTGYRDLYEYNLKTKEKKCLQKNARIGSLAVQPKTGSLWGILTHHGVSTLIELSKNKCNFKIQAQTNADTALSQLAFSPSGAFLALVQRQSGHPQQLRVFSQENYENGLKDPNIITDKGNPEHPAWDAAGETLYWNSSLNGVSNIYSARLSHAKEKHLHSNALTGLFHPKSITSSKLFCFDYTPSGFRPGLLDLKEVSHLNAITFFNQVTLDHNPELKTLGFRHHKKPAYLSEKILYNPWLNWRYNYTAPHFYFTKGIPLWGVGTYFSDPAALTHLSIRTHWLKNRTMFNFTLSYSDILTLQMDNGPTDFAGLLNIQDSDIPLEFRCDYTHWFINKKPELLYTKFQYKRNPSAQVIGIHMSQEFLNHTIGYREEEYGHSTRLTLENRSIKANQQLRLSGQLEKRWLTQLPHHILRAQISGGTSEPGWKFVINNAPATPIYGTTEHPYRQSLRFYGSKKQSYQHYAVIQLESIFPPVNIYQRIGNLTCEALTFSSFITGLWTDADQAQFNWGLHSEFYFKSLYLLEHNLFLTLYLPTNEQSQHIEAGLKWFL